MVDQFLYLIVIIVYLFKLDSLPIVYVNQNTDNYKDPSGMT